MVEFWEECSECSCPFVEIRLSFMLFGSATRVGKELEVEDVVDDEPEIRIVCGECETDFTMSFTEDDLNKLTGTVMEFYERE